MTQDIDTTELERFFTQFTQELETRFDELLTRIGAIESRLHRLEREANHGND